MVLGTNLTVACVRSVTVIIKHKTIITINVFLDLKGIYQASITYAPPSDPSGTHNSRYVHGYGSCAEFALTRALKRYNEIPDTWDGIE